MSTKDPIPKKVRSAARIVERSTADINDVQAQELPGEVKKKERVGRKPIRRIPEPESTTQPDLHKPTNEAANHPVMAKVETIPIKPPRGKHRRKDIKKISKKDYYDAFRSNKSSFFSVETPGPDKDKSGLVKDGAIFITPTALSIDTTYSPVKEPEAITRTPAPPRKRALDPLVEEAESARILRNYVREVANMKIEFEKARMKEEALFEQGKAQAPLAMKKETLSQESTTTRVTPIYTVRRPHADPNPNSTGSSNGKRKNPFTQTQGADGFVLPSPSPIARKKVRLELSSQKQEMAEPVAQDLMERNLDKPNLIKKSKKILPGDSESELGRFIYMAGSPNVTADKPTSSDSSITEKGNSDSRSTVMKERLPLRTTNNPTCAREALAVKNIIEWGNVNVAQENVMVKTQSYNLLEHVQNANLGSGSGIRRRMLPDRFWVPKTNFKNEFLLHKDLEKYFNHSTGARLSLSQHFPPTFTLPQPSDSTLAYIALQIHHAAQQAGVSDTIGGWAVMPVLFSCGKSKIPGVGIVLPDVKLAARIDFRGWPFLVEGAEIVGETTIETSKPGAGDKETKDNKHHHDQESDTDTEPLIETKIVKVPENSRDNISTADYYNNESSRYKYIPPSRPLNLKDLESTTLRADHLTISFSIHDSTISPGDMVYTNNGSVGQVCARRAHTSLKDNAVRRVVTREYCAETLDGSIFCQGGDRGSQVWCDEDGGVRECGKILAAVVGTGAALVSVGLICPLRAEA